MLAQNGIIMDEIGAKYDSEYDLIHQLQEKKAIIADLENQINNLSTKQLVSNNNLSTTCQPNNLFASEKREKFFEWLDVNNFPMNPCFRRFKKYNKRAEFNDVLALYEIFLAQNQP
jgi:hypothetical protein